MVVREVPEDDTWEVLIVPENEKDAALELDVTCMKETIFEDENRRSIYLQHNPSGSIGNVDQTSSSPCLVLGIEQLVPFLMLKVWRERNLVILSKDKCLQLFDGKSMQYKYHLDDLNVISYEKPFKGRQYVLAIYGGSAQDVLTKDVLKEKYLYLSFSTESDRALVQSELQSLRAN